MVGDMVRDRNCLGEHGGVQHLRAISGECGAALLGGLLVGRIVKGHRQLSLGVLPDIFNSIWGCTINQVGGSQLADELKVMGEHTAMTTKPARLASWTAIAPTDPLAPQTGK